MKNIINSQVTLSRPLEGPLAPHIVAFAKWVSEQGYSPFSLHRQVLLASGFSRWLGHKGVKVQKVTSAHPEQYLRYRVRRVRIGNGDASALRSLMGFLRRKEVIPPAKDVPKVMTPAEHCVKEFEQYLQEERALATATIIIYLPFIRELLRKRFGNTEVQLGKLCARDIVGFVQWRAPQLHLKRAKLMTTALRSFLRYACYRGDLMLDLAAAIPAVANWSMTSIPRAIPADQVCTLLQSIDRSKTIGRRNYAILLLLARLGLRSGEVAFLELKDIDWTAGTLSVDGKSGRRSELPLPADVGEAIVAYLQNGRPQSSSRRVFLRHRAPIRGFVGPCAIGSVVHHAIERAGINPPTHGAHQFRHGLATQMLAGGASLTEIGQLLGHRSPETTKIYIKVDVEALRALALPWPGGVK